MKMVKIYFRNEREFDSYQVKSLQDKHKLMSEKYEIGEYGESVNYARTLIESTCKYVYHELTGNEIELDHGRLTHAGDYFLNLNDQITICIDKLVTLVEYPAQLKSMDDNIVNLVNTIGHIRNGSAVSHGSRTRNTPPEKAETRFIISIAEDVCMLFMDLLRERTILEKENAIGSIINTEGLTKYDEDYQKVDELLTVRYSTHGGIIFQVDLTFNKQYITQAIDSEFINGHVKDYLPDDVGSMDKIGTNEYKYHSDRQDKYYTVEIVDTDNNLMIYISGIETK